MRDLTIFMSCTAPVHVPHDFNIFTLDKTGTMTFLVRSVTGKELFSARLSLGKFLGIHGHFSH